MPQIQRVWQANMQVYGADEVWRNWRAKALPWPAARSRDWQVLPRRRRPALDVVGVLDAGVQAAWVVRTPEDERVPWSHGAQPPQLIVPDLLALCRALGRD